MHNIYKILLKTSTAHIKHTTTSILSHPSSKGTKVVLQYKNRTPTLTLTVAP